MFLDFSTNVNAKGKALNSLCNSKIKEKYDEFENDRFDDAHF